MKIYSKEEINQFKSEPNLELWTVIIPAAGKGTRLGYSKPKILYPIAGRSILDWLIDLLIPQCGKLFFVLSPENAPYVEPILKEKLPDCARAVIIKNSRGMADSIYRAVPDIETPFTLIIWGDQVAISPETVKTIQKIQQSIPEAGLTLPLVQRENPYVHYATDKDDKFTHVLEKREEAQMPAIGESDCGLFAFNTGRLKEIFQMEIDKGITFSKSTKEWNFLPMLPMFEKGGRSVNACRLESFEETVGVNDMKDVAILEKYFNKMQKI